MSSPVMGPTKNTPCDTPSFAAKSTKSSRSTPPPTNTQRAFGISCNTRDRKSTRLNSSHSQISYAVFCLKKKKPDQSTHNREPGVEGGRNGGTTDIVGNLLKAHGLSHYCHARTLVRTRIDVSMANRSAPA